MTMISKLKVAWVVMIFMAAAGMVKAADVDCFSRGVAYTILNDGSGTFPVMEAGEVFVSLTDDATPEWTSGTYTSQVAINNGNATSGKVKQNFYFWARAKEGYQFIGWNTSKTGKTAASGSQTEAAPYLKTYTHWSAGTAEAPKEQVMYAIFEKVAGSDSEPEDKGDGASLSAVENNEFVLGSTSKNYSVKVVFSQALLFVDKAKASEGYGVNAELLPYVSCTGADQSKVTVSKVMINAAYQEGSYTQFQPAYGVVELPNTMAVGTYTIHLPYGLFNTTEGGVTASCNFQVTVKNDDTPLVLQSQLPEDKSVWDANPESETFDGESIVVTLNYNKTIARVNTDKEITLVSQSGRTYNPESCTISMLKASQGIVMFGKLPNGTYTYSMPKDVFVGANGFGNEPLTFSFTVQGSKVDEWALPTYTNVNVSPSDASTVRSLTQICIELSRDGYADPIGVLPAKGQVIATKVTYVMPDNYDPNDPEVMPQMHRDTIHGVSAAVKNGKLLVNFATPLSEESRVDVVVPEGIVNNLAMPVATMTSKEIYDEGGCTNPTIRLSYNIQPVSIKVLDVTGIGVFDRFEQDSLGHDVRVDSYKSLVDAQLVPPVNNGDEGDRITYIYFWYPEDFATIAYAGGASITNITSQKPYNIAAIEFKTGGDAYRKNVIQMRLSTENFIHSDVYDQGVYEVILPGGFARTADGMVNEGFTFRFTYGDPEKAYHPEELNLDDYLGNYRNVQDEGESLDLETFKLEKIDGSYCITGLCGSSLVIPVESNNSGTVLKFTENTAGEAFMSYSGGDVVASFAQEGGKNYIFIDQYALYLANGDQKVGGAMYYEQYDPSAIESVNSETSLPVFYNLVGQRCFGSKGYRFGKGIKLFVK